MGPLRRRFPRATIHLFAPERLSPLMRTITEVDAVNSAIADAGQPFPCLVKAARTIQNLAKNNYDLVIDFSARRWGGLISKMLSAPTRVGFASSPLGNNLFHTDILTPSPGSSRAATLVAAFGSDYLPARPVFNLPPTVLEWSRGLINPAPRPAIAVMGSLDDIGHDLSRQIPGGASLVIVHDAARRNIERLASRATLIDARSSDLVHDAAILMACDRVVATDVECRALALAVGAPLLDEAPAVSIPFRRWDSPSTLLPSSQLARTPREAA